MFNNHVTLNIREGPQEVYCPSLQAFSFCKPEGRGLGRKEILRSDEWIPQGRLFFDGPFDLCVEELQVRKKTVGVSATRYPMQDLNRPLTVPYVWSKKSSRG